MSESERKAQELVELFVNGQTYAIETNDRSQLTRLLGKTAANTFPFKKELFPSEVFSDICTFVTKESLKIMAEATEEERKAYLLGNGGTFKSELAEKLRPIFLKKVAALIFNEGTMELNPFFKNLFAQANKKRVAEGKAPLLLTEELKLDLFENYCLLCGNAVLTELQVSMDEITTEEAPFDGMLLSTVITGITGNHENIKKSSQDFFAGLEANEKHFVPKTTFLGSASHKRLSEIKDEKVKQYVAWRTLFEETLENYKTMQAALNSDGAEVLQDLDPISVAGRELLADTDKTAEAVDSEGIGHLATVLEYATRKLQDVIDSNVQSGAVFRLPVAKAKECNEKKFDRAIAELRSEKYDKIVFSATRFLEVVANAVVNGFLLAVTAIANTAPSLLSSVPPVAAPSVTLSPSSTAIRQKEKVSGSLGLFFTEFSKQRLVALPKVDMSDQPMKTPMSETRVPETYKGKGKEKETSSSRVESTPHPIMVGGPTR